MAATTCPPDIRGRAGTGSVLSLDAIGKQDQVLLGDYSFFRYSQKRHTNFQVYQTVTNVTSTSDSLNWPFDNSTVTVTLYPKQMGDLLTHMYIQCTMPHLQDVGTPQVPGMFPDSRYCANLGRAIIQSIKFRVDQYEIETLYDDWMHMYDALYLTQEQKTANSDMIQGVGNRTSGPLDLYIPLPFFFSAKSGSYFPLCACTNQKITLEILFNPVQYFSNTRIDNLSPKYYLGLGSFNVVCEQIVLSDLERLYFMQNGHKMLSRVALKQPEVLVKPLTGKTSVKLVMDAPVENIHWVLRQYIYEKEDVPGVTNYFLNRYNYSASNSSNLIVQSNNPIMSDVTVFINNKSELGFFAFSDNSDVKSASNYYKFAEPLKSKLSAPIENVYSYALCLNGLDNDLSGALDFNKVPAQSTFLNINLLASAAKNKLSNGYTVQTYYVALRELSFSGGFMSF